MKPLLLDQFGEASLRRLARQSGLRGAETLPRPVLEAGLTTYLSLRPSREAADADADADAEDPGAPAPDLVPPALATETMARLLEQQGKTAAAARLRGRREAPGPTSDTAPAGIDPDDVGHVRIRVASAKLATVRYRVTEAGRRRAEGALGPGPADWALERVSVTAAGAVTVEHPGLPGPTGELPWRLLPGTRAVAVALGLLARDGRFAAVAYTEPVDLPGTPGLPGEPPPP
jgi:hypothetical protein